MTGNAAGTNESGTLVDLVAIETLERLRKLFETTVGMPLVFTDADGRAVTTVTEPLRFCGTLVFGEGVNTVCLRRKKWDVAEVELENDIRGSHTGSGPASHRCRGGFRDAAVPIMVNGRKLGYAVFARCLVDPPEVSLFREMAQQGGMAAEVGEAVARHAVVIPLERVNQVAEFLQVITNLVAAAAEDTLRAARIIELEKLRDELIHMIVHDLRTPLTGVLTGLRTVVAADYDEEIVAEFIPAAIESAETLLEMVNTLLDVNKLESGQMRLDLTPVDFVRLAHVALKQVARLAEESHQELACELAPAGPPLLADEDKLRRVLVNLLGNALKFTPAGGRVALSNSWDETGLTFSVSDNGPGLPPEYREKIFDKFCQVETPDAKRPHSTGLGLTFCKRVCEAHGGRIWVESQPGQGSTFAAFLPWAPSSP